MKLLPKKWGRVIDHKPRKRRTLKTNIHCFTPDLKLIFFNNNKFLLGARPGVRGPPPLVLRLSRACGYASGGLWAARWKRVLSAMKRKATIIQSY